MKQILKPLALAIGTLLVLTGTSVFAEQRIGIQPSGTAASAATTVNVRVVVPKIVILRIGDTTANPPDVTFTVGTTPAGPGNSIAYPAGTIPPTLTTSAATTNPTTALGVLDVGAWSNAAATLTCATAALGGTTAFNAGATAGGVPGLNDITITDSGGLARPAANLGGCPGSSAIAARTTLGGTFTFGTAFTATALAPATYGVAVTFTASVP